MAENNEKKIEELKAKAEELERSIKEKQEKIEEWKKELTEIWEGVDTDAAEVERRNLKDLIFNAEAELESAKRSLKRTKNQIEKEENSREQGGNGSGNRKPNSKSDNKKEDSTKPKRKTVKPEDILEKLKLEEQNKVRLQLRLERLKEEREYYTGHKDIYDEYTRQIEEIEKELSVEKTQDEKDMEIKALTQGRMKAEENAKKTEFEIEKLQFKLKAMDRGIEEPLKEITLTTGEKVKVPKAIEINKEIEKLQQELKAEKSKIEEYQDAIDKVKGINKDEKQEVRELDPEEIRYFHGQGDLRENVKSDSKEDVRGNRRGNDEYFGFGPKPGKGKEIKPDPEPVPPPPVPPTPDPIPVPPVPPVPEKPKGPRRFEEIVSEIEAAKNEMSYAEMSRYESAKGKWLVPVQYDKGDWLHNTFRFLVQGVLGTIINVPRKIYSKIRTGKEQEEKVKEITENVDNLSPEDFEVLVDGLQSYLGDVNKESASLRRAVQQRLERETIIKNIERDEEIEKSFTNIDENKVLIKEIEAKLESKNLTDEEKQKLKAEKVKLYESSALSVREIQKLRREGSLAQGGKGVHGLAEESKAAKEGANLEGRKLAKRTSNNEELEKEQAKLKKAEREANESGDYEKEVKAFMKHEKLLEENTWTKNIAGITVSKSDRHHTRGVLRKEYKEDDLVRNILTVATVTATTVNVIKQIRNQAILDQANTEIDKANLDNQGMAQKAEGLRQEVIGNEDVVDKGIEATNDTRTASAWAAGHEHAGTTHNFQGQWGSSKEDIMFHQIMSGTVDNDTLKQFIQQGLPTIKKYAASHPNYDYDALIDSLTNLGNGGVEAITQYNSAMKTLIENAVKTGEITSTAVGHINLSPTYIETMIPLVLAGKAATSKEYRKAEKKAKKKEEKQNKKEQKYISESEDEERC